MKILSYNVNGIRAAIKKGFIEWLAESNPDIIGLQEVKATIEQIDASVFHNLGYKVYWYPAFKKGYSGVAVLSKIEPKSVTYGMNNEAYDSEGRLIELEFEDFSFLSAYFPSGTTGDIRQDFKYKFLDDIYDYIHELKKRKPNLILSGDYNICHKEIDIHNPKSNKNSSGFLPEERAWMDKFTNSGFIDSFRHFNKEPHNYSWWSYRANARAKNLGWRIDYHMVTENMKNKLKGASILPDVKHSDHCPIQIELV